MDINTPDDFIDIPVIDIDVEFGGAVPPGRWTVKDEPATKFKNQQLAISFLFRPDNGPAQEVRLERRFIAWSGITRRIDRVPVKKVGGAQTAP